MKLTFNTKQSSHGTRVYRIDTTAAKKAKRSLTSSTRAEKYDLRSAHNIMLDPPKVKMIKGVEYLDI